MQCSCGASDLFDAAKKGCDDCCRRMSGQAGKTRDDIHFDGLTDQKNRTALMVAAFYGKTGCVRILAEKEAKMQDEEKWTALIHAARNGHHECVEILAPLEKGMQNNNGWTGLMYAAWKGHSECVKILAQLEKLMKDKDG